MGVQGDSEYVGGGGGDTSTAGADSGLITGAPIASMSSGPSGGGDDSAITTPTWLKTSSRWESYFHWKICSFYSVLLTLSVNLFVF